MVSNDRRGSDQPPVLVTATGLALIGALLRGELTAVVLGDDLVALREDVVGLGSAADGFGVEAPHPAAKETARIKAAAYQSASPPAKSCRHRSAKPAVAMGKLQCRSRLSPSMRCITGRRGDQASSLCGMTATGSSAFMNKARLDLDALVEGRPFS